MSENNQANTIYTLCDELAVVRGELRDSLKEERIFKDKITALAMGKHSNADELRREIWKLLGVEF